MSNQLSCIACGQLILAEDVNLQNMVAKCRNCNAVFSFAPANADASNLSILETVHELMREANRQQSSTFARPNDGRRIEMPKGVITERDFGELRFIIPWRNTRRWGFFLLFTIVWNAILTPFIVMGVATGEWRILLFASLHILVGVSFLMYTLGLMLNKTSIVVTSQGVDIKNGPIPIPFNPNRFMAVRDIEQLFVEEYVPSKTNGRPDYTYAVTALTTSAERQRLVGGFSQPGHALYLEQEIETFLNIKDKPVF
ncbi:MAG: hypothetical protein SFV55_25240 [Haliscomenobacter sp.]|uniref:hypothetical protein n=1 Tax=Haliscomenobacter sp. TaxID=2717303 RepID=UPI0029B29A72|nr:hypothetical protein [Haliscomenobacter sp.]MDX2071762.1 hypothetical protein [Haliscomenobacter sp.]